MPSDGGKVKDQVLEEKGQQREVGGVSKGGPPILRMHQGGHTNIVGNSQ